MLVWDLEQPALVLSILPRPSSQAKDSPPRSLHVPRTRGVCTEEAPGSSPREGVPHDDQRVRASVGGGNPAPVLAHTQARDGVRVALVGEREKHRDAPRQSFVSSIHQLLGCGISSSSLPGVICFPPSVPTGLTGVPKTAGVPAAPRRLLWPHAGTRMREKGRCLG